MSEVAERPAEVYRYLRYAELLRRALHETDDVTEAMLAAELALSMEPIDVALGMVGDEWHGPQPPGEGWVEVKRGPHGGKVWRKSGGKNIASSGHSPPTQSILKSIADGNAIQAVKTYRSLTPEWKAKVAKEIPAAAKKAMNEAAKGNKASNLPSDDEIDNAKPKPFRTASLHEGNLGSLEVGGKTFFYKVNLEPAETKSEVTVSELAQIAGVPVPRARRIKPSWAQTEGVVAEMLDGKPLYDPSHDWTADELIAATSEDDYWDQLYFAYVADIADAHENNYMIAGKRLYRVDNETGFRPTQRPNSTISIWMNCLFHMRGREAVDAPDRVKMDRRRAARMASRVGDMAAHLEKSGGHEEQQIDWLKKRGQVLQEFSEGSDDTLGALQAIHERLLPRRRVE